MTILERFLKIYDSILKALGDLNCSNYINNDYLAIICDLVNTLKPVKIAEETLGRRDANLIISEGMLVFLYNS